MVGAGAAITVPPGTATEVRLRVMPAVVVNAVTAGVSKVVLRLLPVAVVFTTSCVEEVCTSTR
jgi:hypothetical protein